MTPPTHSVVFERKTWRNTEDSVLTPIPVTRISNRFAEVQVLYSREIDPCPPPGGTHPTLRMGPSRIRWMSVGWQCLGGSIHPAGGIFHLQQGVRSLISPTVVGRGLARTHIYQRNVRTGSLYIGNITFAVTTLFTCWFHIYCKWEERHKEMNGPEQPLAMNMKLFLLSAIWRHLLRWLFPSWLDQNWLICGRPPPHWSLLLESSWPNLSSLWSSVRPTFTLYYIIYEQLINDHFL